jgi:thiol-disulfide isomerase/thioredoxin
VGRLFVTCSLKFKIIYKSLKMKKYYFLIFSILIMTSCETKTTENIQQQPIQQPLKQEVIAKVDIFESTTFQTLDGKTVDLKAYKGKRVLVNLWATWCGPCVKEMPSLEAAYQELKAENYIFLAASNEDFALINGFVNRTNYNFDFLKLDENFTPFDISVLPTTFIFDSEGKLAKRLVGSMAWNSKTVLEDLRSVK